jgi:hypothetical protein
MQATAKSPSLWLDHPPQSYFASAITLPVHEFDDIRV